jgi:hypothetical protein
MVLPRSEKREQRGGSLVAEVEEIAELHLREELCGEIPKGTTGEFEFDFVAEEGAGDFLPRFRGEAVAVTPVGEGAAMLDVAEVIVPEELGDFGVPGDAEGRVGEGAEAEGHAGSRAGDDAGVEAACGRTRRRWGKGGFLDAGFLPGRHEAREVLRVGEEGEDVLGGEGKPLLGLEGVAHSFRYTDARTPPGWCGRRFFRAVKVR